MIAIVDLDGTLVRCEDRIHYIRNPHTGEMLSPIFRDWPAFHEAGTRAPAYPNVNRIVRLLHHSGIDIHILTGRPEPYRESTIEWLSKHEVPCQRLMMRGAEDFRSDVEFKGLFLRTYIPDDVLVILEDRDAVVAMARSMGFTVFQVNPGAF